jgi:cell division protein FtsQ
MASRKIKKRKNKKAKEPLTWRLKGVVLRTARTLGIVIMGVVLFYLGTVVYEEFHTAPYLEVKAITVEGAERIYDHEIIELSGFIMGSNIFSFDLDEARTRVISHPFIKEG